MISPPLTTSVVNAIQEDRRASASGILQMMGQVGAVAAITVSGAIVAAGHGPGRFATAFLVAAFQRCSAWRRPGSSRHARRLVRTRKALRQRHQRRQMTNPDRTTKTAARVGRGFLGLDRGNR